MRAGAAKPRDARNKGSSPRRKKCPLVPLPSRAISHACDHLQLRVSRFARRTTEKRETARSLVKNAKRSQNQKPISCRSRPCSKRAMGSFQRFSPAGLSFCPAHF